MAAIRVFLIAIMLAASLGAAETSRATDETQYFVVGPVAYGDDPKFWKSHTLVIGTVEEVRMEDDGKSVTAFEHVTLRVEESIPDRHGNKRPLLRVAFARLFGSVRDRPQQPPDPLYTKGDRLMMLVPETEDRIVLGYFMASDARRRGIHQSEYFHFAMMPRGFQAYGGKVFRQFGKSDDLIVTETKRLCRILTTDDAATRITNIDAMLKVKPTQRVEAVLTRSLQSTIKELESNLQQARSLLERLK